MGDRKDTWPQTRVPRPVRLGGEAPGGHRHLQRQQGQDDERGAGNGRQGSASRLTVRFFFVLS